MSNEVPKFRVTANSRLPFLGSSYYDDNTHRYSPGYVNPSSYGLRVDAFPETEVIFKKPAKPGFGLEKPGQGGAVEISRIIVPDGTIAVDYSIKGTGFSDSKSNPVGSLEFSEDEPLLDSPWEQTLFVPQEGTYDITVKLRDKTGGGPENTRQFSVQDFLIVSIGDSSASGQGNPDVPGTPKGFAPDIAWWEVFIPPALLYEIEKAAYEAMRDEFKTKFTSAAQARGWTIDMDPNPMWLEKKAYRSLRSGPALAAHKLENPRQGELVSFLSFARSGADIQSGLLEPCSDAWIGNIGQVHEAKNTLGSRRIDALLISIGINDVGVTGTLNDLVVGDSKWFGKTGGDAQAARDQAYRSTLQKLEQLPTKFDALADALKVLNVGDIYLIEYPTALFDQENGEVDEGSCGIFSHDTFDLDLDKKDTFLVKDLAERLNEKLKEVAQEHRWTFVSGIAAGFRGRGYCTNDKVRCFVQAEESMIIQGDTEGTIHPNAKGHTIVGDCIAKTLKGHLLTPQKNWLEPVLYVMMG